MFNKWCRHFSNLFSDSSITQASYWATVGKNYSQHWQNILTKTIRMEIVLPTFKVAKLGSRIPINKTRKNSIIFHLYKTTKHQAWYTHFKRCASKSSLIFNVSYHQTYPIKGHLKNKLINKIMSCQSIMKKMLENSNYFYLLAGREAPPL